MNIFRGIFFLKFRLIDDEHVFDLGFIKLYYFKLI